MALRVPNGSLRPPKKIPICRARNFDISRSTNQNCTTMRWCEMEVWRIASQLRVPSGSLPTLKKLKPFAYLKISIYVALQTETGPLFVGVEWKFGEWCDNSFVLVIGQHSKLRASLFRNRGVKLVITTSQKTCFASGLADYALLLCRKFAAKLPHQVCHDKLISRKIKLAASVNAIWEAPPHGCDLGHGLD
ncbi:hypothetical protein AVEN_267454-1 [Araneus ventricosus]|uniref:Uncharacterized protein n=1 Tax=Araneus ventricosus TaxID=182803 RepID=A0A4Y2F6B8_ARAVE|nr:hypothetical protein AVEN_267454-1 [Araneus ventricosus]